MRWSAEGVVFHFLVIVTFYIFFSLFREQESGYFSLVRNEMGPVGHGNSARLWKVLISAVPKGVISVNKTQGLNPHKGQCRHWV